MNLKETAKNNMYKAVEDFFTENEASFAGYGRAKTEIVKFAANNQTLNNYINHQSGSSKGVTGQKSAGYANMVSLTVKASRKALVYAIDNSDNTLQQLFDVQAYDFNQSTDTKALSMAKNIYAGLKPLAGQLDDYRIPAADIKAIGDAIIAFEALSGTPETAQAASEAGTQGIKTTMPLIDKNLAILDDLIVHGMDDDPDLVNAYRKVRKIKVAGTRHTGLIATINDAGGNAIEGATVHVQELKKQAVSDISGVADIESMKPGTYHIIFSANGYASQTQILKIEQGKTLDEEVVLVREAS